MRHDIKGLFWDDTPPPKLTKPPPPKRTPPARTWEAPDYLPGLAEAQAFAVPLFESWEEVEATQRKGIPLVFDIEVFENYFLASFQCTVTGRVFFFEAFNEPLDASSRAMLSWTLQNFLTVGFNSNLFDIPVTEFALNNFWGKTLKNLVNLIISDEVKPWQLLRSHRIRQTRYNHIDLIDVCPLSASLKIYGGRLHCQKMQELPFAHTTILSAEQRDIVRFYNINDLRVTRLLFASLSAQVDLRSKMSILYGVDLRSKSDAQIAEAVINAELQRITGEKPERPEIEPGYSFEYKVPHYLNFKSKTLNDVLDIIRKARFILDETGSPIMPENIKRLLIPIGGNSYQMGIGGLHSTEEKLTIIPKDGQRLIDRDVTSYYPSIILNQGLFPRHLGNDFLVVYRTLVERRIRAKKEGNKTEADTLKIVVNGCFGKLGNKWSSLYSPDLMIQVTISGQLTLLLLIEWLELEGVRVCSANTDGILILVDAGQQSLVDHIICEWERQTGFTTEESEYLGMFARDVNNYIGIKKDGGVKVKGTYSERGSAGDSVLSKNPEFLICNDAIVEFLKSGRPIAETIKACRDIRRFVSVRTVKGGAVKAGEWLGKAIRFYWSLTAGGEIVYAMTGNRVPKSTGARPCMELPDKFPEDVDFDRYVAEAKSVLFDIGYLKKEEAE